MPSLPSHILSIVCCTLILLCQFCFASQTMDVQGKFIALPVTSAPLQIDLYIVNSNTLQQKIIPVFKDGTFLMPQMPIGSYLISVDCKSSACPVFPSSIRMDILSSNNNLLVKAITNDGTRKVLKTSPQLIIAPLAQLFDTNSPLQFVSYFEKKEPFNPLSYLKNPMVLIMLVLGGFAFLMPKLIDPEAIKEMQKQATDSADPNDPIQQMAMKFLGGGNTAASTSSSTDSKKKK